MLEAIMMWDERLFRLINGDWHSPLFDMLFPVVTDAKTYTLPFVLAALVLIAVGRWRGLRFVILAAVSVLVADALSQHLVKSLVERARPCNALEEVRLLVGCTTSLSFPSNHAVNASVIATQVASSARLLLLPAAATAILVAYSRIYVGVHYPLDVLAGCVLGIVVARTLSWVVATIWRFLPRSREAF
jgi:undecaprenyl-diphosphatase